MVPVVNRRSWWIALLFVGLAIVATWPIARAPASRAYFDHPDAQLNMWIMAWDAHAVRTDPANLFNANIFYPERNTLAYSETLLGYFPLFAPVIWLGGTPALAFNLVLLFSLAASGFAMYLLVQHLTGRQWPSMAAGVAYAFLPYRFVHVPQIQLEALEWLPAAFLCLHLYVERGQVRYALGLAAVAAIETLCCVYYGMFLAVALATAVLAIAATDRRARRATWFAMLAGAAVAGAIAVAPVASVYARVHDKSGLERSSEEMSARSADLATYFSSTAPLNAPILRAIGTPRDYLFPGFLVLLLAAVGLLSAARSRILWVYCTVAVVGAWASFGPPGIFGVSLFNGLEHLIPPMRALRQISRFGVLPLFSVCVIAGIGCAEVERRLSPGGRRRVWQIGVVALLFAEMFQAPLRADRPGGVALGVIPPPPPVYRWLREQRGPYAIVEMPVAHEGQLWRNAPYVYWSTIHWHPVVDAYSGFAPNSYASLRLVLEQFPDPLSRRALQIRDVRYVVVHWDRRTDLRFGPERLARTPWLRSVVSFGDAEVFELIQDDQDARVDGR